MNHFNKPRTAMKFTSNKNVSPQLQYIPVFVQNEHILKLNCKTRCMFHTLHFLPLNQNPHHQTTEHLSPVSVVLSVTFDVSPIATELMEISTYGDAGKMFEQILP